MHPTAPLRHQLVQTSLQMLGVVAGLVLAFDLATGDLRGAAAIAAPALLSWPLARLAARGHAALGAHLVLLTMVVGSGLVAVQGAGIYGDAVLFLMSAPVLAALLTGLRGAIGWGLAAWGIVGATVLLHGTGALPEAAAQVPTPAERMQDMGIILALNGSVAGAFLVVQGRAMRGQRQALAQLQAEVAERRLAEERAQAAAAEREAFVATMSHELRNPLSGILCATTLLRETDDATELAHLTDVLEQSGRGMLELVNGVLDLSRLDAGNIQLESVPVMIRTLVRETLSPLGIMAEQKGLRWSWSVDDTVPAVILTDPTRLRQVLLNLVGNALRFTRTGAVEVRLARAGDALRIDIHDTGAGIPAAALDTLFDPYAGGDKSIRREVGGSVLGLAIVKRTAEALGGDISVRSAVGEGSCFTVKIRLVESGAAPRKVEGESFDGHGMRVLVVDDNPVARTVHRSVLGAWNFEARSAGDGPTALSQLRGDPPDVVLLDCQMPGMDGLEVARRIRGMGGTPARVAIFGLSGDARPEAHDEALAAGMDAYLTKPLRPGPLAAALRAWNTTARASAG